MSKMNIAFYTDSFYPAVDGVVISISNFTRELEKRGHKVYIFTAGNSKNNDKSMNVFFMRGIKFSKYPQYTVAMFPFLSSLKMRELDIDIVHAHTPFSIGLAALTNARLNKLPLVSTFHTLFNDNAVINEYVSSNNFMRDAIKKYSWNYAKFFYNKCDRVITPSVTIEDLLKKNGITNTTVVENGIDLKKFNNKIRSMHVKNWITDGKDYKLVLYVGRISKEKRIDTLLKAANILKNKRIFFGIVGTGPALEHYKEIAQKYKLDKVKFLGFVENNDLPKYYNAADIFCIPSTFETQGIVSIEAMACGKPVVGADYMALKELIINGVNGEKFKPGDFKDCAKKIEKVLDNIEEYNKTISTIKKYSIEKVTDKLIKVYEELI